MRHWCQFGPRTPRGVGATRATSTDMVPPGGGIAHVGFGPDSLGVRRMALQQFTFIEIHTYAKQGFRTTVEAIFDGYLRLPDWTESRPLSDGFQALKEQRDGAVASPKIILHSWT